MTEKSNKRDRNHACRVFIGNLDYHTTIDEITNMLEPYGPVIDVYFPRDKTRPVPRLTQRKRHKNEPVNYGCAFIEFDNPESADKLLRDTDTEILDPYTRKIYISKAERSL